jgi:DNA-binding MarR family transcriptional regulator
MELSIELVKIAVNYKKRLKLEDEIKQRKFKNSSQKAILNIIFTANWINSIFRDIFKPFGVTQQQYNVLRILKGRYPGTVNPTEIKDVMLDKNPDLTRLCDRMHANGWLQRDIDETNRRKMNITITEKGLDLLARIQPVLESAEGQFTYMTDEAKEQLSSLLDQFRG